MAIDLEYAKERVDAGEILHDHSIQYLKRRMHQLENSIEKRGDVVAAIRYILEKDAALKLKRENRE